MVSKNHPNNACCYYVSWDNTPLTGALLIAENLLFYLIWSYEFEPITLVTTLSFLYLLWKLLTKSFKLDLNCCCCKTCNSETCVKEAFEKIYERSNSAIDTFRHYSHGPRALLLLILLFLVRSLNICVLCAAWYLAMWSFIEPALLKFAKIDIRAIWDMVINNNPLEDQLDFVLSMIPKATIAGKRD